MSPFIHLRAHSAYSLLKGAIKIPDLVKLAVAHDMPAIGLVDHDNLFGSLEFSEYAAKAGVQPIVGMTVSLVPYGLSQQTGSLRQAPDQLLLYAKDAKGYANLLKIASAEYLAPAQNQPPLLEYETVLAHHEGLIALTASTQGGFGKLLTLGRHAEAEKLIQQLHEAFGDRLYIEITRHGLAQEKRIERPQIDVALARHIPLVATNNIYFSDKEMFDAHDALMCIEAGHFVADADRERLNPEHYFKSPQTMRLLFQDLPEALENTAIIAKRCHSWSASRAPILPGYHLTDDAGNVLSESEALRAKALQGLQARLERYVFTPDLSDEEKSRIATPYRERLEYELDVIITMKFPGYFLIVSDFIGWAKDNHIPVGPGRGSGAGSLVAWVLRITDLDPLRYGLLFERFLNPERVSMPDFDIDFCQDRRDEVIRYVSQKYGYERVAQIITFGKLQARAVLRDVGRVLQMPYSQVDRICKMVPNNPAAPVTLEQAIDLEPMLKQAIDEDDTVARLVELSLKLEGLYRHASTHAAGVVIGDRPLGDLVPLYRDPHSQMLVVQYSMKWAEAAGLVKFDFLGLRTLTILQACVDILAHKGVAVDLSALPESDPKTYQLLSRADTLGVFQFESAGMREALKQLRPDCIEDLIALGALYRPGPMDNIPTYIEVKHGRKAADYLHPLLEPVLKETYGVIIYQEQVQKIAQVLAGYTLGGADLLRRAMGKKIKAEMDAQRERFIVGAEQNNVPRGQAAAIFDLVDKFAGYGFNKSHAAAYAVVAYQTAYLKANYPVAFFAASMTYEMGSTDKLADFVQDAQRLSIAVLPPDINASGVYFSVEAMADGTQAVRYALAAIKNVGAAAMQAVVDERARQGAFSDIHDFVSRIDASVINRRQLEHLIAAGCFDSLHSNRRQLYESIDRLIAVAQQSTADRISNQISLFGQTIAASVQDKQLKAVEEWPMAEKLNHERAAIGFYLSSHPLTAYAGLLKKMGVSPSTRLHQKLNDRTSLKLAGVLISNRLRSSPRGRAAFLLLSDADGQFEITIFDEYLLNQSHALLVEGTALLIQADVRVSDRGTRLIASKIEKLDGAVGAIKPSAISVRVEDASMLDALKQTLGVRQEKGAKVVLMVEVPGGMVKIGLPGAYAIAASELLAIQSMRGVEAQAA